VKNTDLLRNSATAHDSRATKVPHQGCATKARNKSLRVPSGLEG